MVKVCTVRSQQLKDSVVILSLIVLHDVQQILLSTMSCIITIQLWFQLSVALATYSIIMYICFLFTIIVTQLHDAYTSTVEPSPFCAC